MSYKSLEEEIASRMYELDAESYENSQSSLGKLFPGTKAASVKKTVESLQNKDRKLLNNMIMLIGNMVHTVAPGDVYDNLEAEYIALSKMVDEYFEKNVSPEFSMEQYSLQARYHAGEYRHTAICIGREFGSGGHEIGYKLAQKLGYSFYDKEIFELATKDLDAGNNRIEADERVDKASLSSRLFGNERKISFFGISQSDAVFFKQSEMIVKIAQNENCVFLGRCADAVLEQQDIPRYSIYIGAPMQARIHRKMTIESISEAEAAELVRHVDKQRKNYYDYYTNRNWGVAGNYDLCINSACFGIDGTVDMIHHMIDLAKIENE